MCPISQRSFDTSDRCDTLLVLAPTFNQTEPATCSDLLVHGDAPEEHVLCITFTRSPADHLVNWRRHGNVPDRATFVRVAASSRSGVGSDEAFGGETPDDIDVTVERVPSPENLTRLGVKVTDDLEAATDEVTDREVRICFDSITALLQYVGVDEGFRFLHVLTDQFSDAETKAHFHMDPRAHDEETIQTLLSVFDDVRAYENGDWTQRK